MSTILFPNIHKIIEDHEIEKYDDIIDDLINYIKDELSKKNDPSDGIEDFCNNLFYIASKKSSLFRNNIVSGIKKNVSNLKKIFLEHVNDLDEIVSHRIVDSLGNLQAALDGSNDIKKVSWIHEIFISDVKEDKVASDISHIVENKFTDIDSDKIVDELLEYIEHDVKISHNISENIEKFSKNISEFIINKNKDLGNKLKSQFIGKITQFKKAISDITENNDILSSHQIINALDKIASYGENTKPGQSKFSSEMIKESMKTKGSNNVKFGDIALFLIGKFDNFSIDIIFKEILDYIKFDLEDKKDPSRNIVKICKNLNEFAMSRDDHFKISLKNALIKNTPLLKQILKSNSKNIEVDRAKIMLKALYSLASTSDMQKISAMEAKWSSGIIAEIFPNSK